MACFDDTQSDQAIEASLGILKDIEQFRRETTEDSVTSYLYTGIGLAQGWVIEGNIGSRTKKDYTLMGDVVNLAARFEAMTRTLNRQIVFSDVMAQKIKKFTVEPLGSHVVKGKMEVVKLYSIQKCRPFSYEKITQTINQLIPAPNKI